MGQFLAEHFGHSVEEFKVGEYLWNVHGGLPLELLVQRPLVVELFRALHCSGVPIFILTNSDEPHARRIVRHLQLDTYVTRILGVFALQWLAKPRHTAYVEAMHAAGVTDPSRCIFFDDSLTNIKGAWEIGMRVVHISEHVPEEDMVFDGGKYEEYTQAAPRDAREHYFAEYDVVPLSSISVVDRHEARSHSLSCMKAFEDGGSSPGGVQVELRVIPEDWVPDEVIDDLAKVKDLPWMRDLILCAPGSPLVPLASTGGKAATDGHPLRFSAIECDVTMPVSEPE